MHGYFQDISSPTLQVCQNVCQASQSPIKLLNAFKFKLPTSGLSISWLHHFYVSTLWNGMEMETMTVFIFLGSKITADGDCSHEIKKTLAPWKKSYDQPSILKSSDINFANKGPSSQSYGFSRSNIWMCKLDHKESWAPKNWCFWTVVLKTLESPLDCKEIKPKGNQSWIFIGRTDAKAETPILWPPEVKNWLLRSDSDAGKDWRQEEKGTTEDEIVGWDHRLDEHEFEPTPGFGDGQRNLACCSPWSHKESDMTERLNWLLLWILFHLHPTFLLVVSSYALCLLLLKNVTWYS